MRRPVPSSWIRRYGSPGGLSKRSTPSTQARRHIAPPGVRSRITEGALARAARQKRVRDLSGAGGVTVFHAEALDGSRQIEVEARAFLRRLGRLPRERAAQVDDAEGFADGVRDRASAIRGREVHPV